MGTELHPISLQGFRNFFTSGGLAQAGAAANQHKLTLLNTHTSKPGVFERAWLCKKPGFHESHGFDVWKHQEKLTQNNAQRDSVEDTFEWHDGKSRAWRAYTVERHGDRQICRNYNDWDMKLKGVPWYERPFVERAMRRELPQAEVKLAAALEAAGAAEERGHRNVG